MQLYNCYLQFRTYTKIFEIFVLKLKYVIFAFINNRNIISFEMFKEFYEKYKNKSMEI